MTVKTAGVAAVVGAGALAAAYFMGYWPERQQRTAREAEVATLREQLTDTEARLRIADLLGQALDLMDVVARQNYGQAQERSSAFFDAVRGESARTPRPRLNAHLEAIHQMRDGVTAALTRADPASLDSLIRIQQRLREALGYPVGGGGSRSPQSE